MLELRELGEVAEAEEVVSKLFSRAHDTQARGGEGGVGEMWVAKKREQHGLRQAGEQG